MQVLKLRPSLVVVLLSTAMLAGCVADAPKPQEEPQATAAEVNDTTGALVGTIINEEGLPIEGATIGLIETGITTTSDSAGEYTLNGIEPGEYSVQAAIVGFEPGVKRITVIAGEISQANFQLTVIAIDVPHYVSDQQFGNIQCSVTIFPGFPMSGMVAGSDGWYSSLQACGLLEDAQAANPLPPSKFDLQFPAPAGTQEFVIEQVWQSTQAAGNGLSVGAEDPGAVNDGEDYGSATGMSPLYLYVPNQKLLNVTVAQGIDAADDDFVVQTRTFSTANTTNQGLPVPIPAIPVFGAPNNQKLDAGLAFDQRFEVWMTAFVGMDRPAGFSALPDA